MKLVGLVIVTVAAALTEIKVPAQSADSASGPRLEKANDLVGMEIIDAHNMRVAKVSDLIIDWDAGRIAEVMVDTGGMLTSKTRTMAVPPECLSLDSTSNTLRLKADLDIFDNGPSVSVADAGKTSGANVADLYKRFRIPSYGPVGTLQPTAKAIGMTVHNRQSQKLGKINGIAVQLPGGNVPAILLEDKAGITAIQPQAFYCEPNLSAVVLDTSKLALGDARYFKPSDWRAAVADMLNPPGTNKATLPIASSVVEGDRTITLEIQRKIMATDGLSNDARHVLVQTSKGRVTLRGMADSEKEKQLIGMIASTVVPADHVDNKIEVRVLANNFTH